MRILLLRKRKKKRQKHEELCCCEPELLHTLRHTPTRRIKRCRNPLQAPARKNKITKLQVTLVLVAAVAAAPKKPTKSFPKKYDSAVHGVKDTYSVYHHTADEDMVVPDFSPFRALLPQIPTFPIREESSYTGLEDTVAEDDMLPPREDTYSSVSGVSHDALVPPPVFPTTKAPSSYLTYEGPGEEPMGPPPTSTYAQPPKDASGSEVLRSLAAMIQALPHISSYTNYRQAAAAHAEDGGPARQIQPPQHPSSSYASVPSQPSSSQDEDGPVVLPLRGLVAPQ
ncbi:uncharacterized protein LOC123516185 isoform X2 [Portunus trituberculatus]|uniref:uncharacterized protein LOC123516185 isoform X2 n=1 Tax=Portunus trituberculatus TaxID=210409 RepID=UPI001E1D1EEF|nr:uncharacterized protein LOC123516185 isoform X2 [Portunus trituberculatus]